MPSSRRSATPRRSAAWRLTAPATLAFALGSAAVLWVAYGVTASQVRRQIDAALTSEAADFAAEARALPPERLPGWLETERRDLLHFFGLSSTRTLASGVDEAVLVVVAPNGSALAWSGIGDPAPLLEALRSRGAHRFHRSRRAGTPRPTTLSVRGLSRPLRVVAWHSRGEVGVVLGVTPPSAQPLLARIATILAILWAVVVAIGATLATWSVRRALRRVETITRAAAAIDAPETGRRLEGGEARDEIGELATTLNGMLDRIAAGAREIRRMSQDAAHDLRTPLTVIRGRLEVALARAPDGAPDGDWQADVAEAVEGLDRLSSMLEAILDVAEAEGSALRLRRESVDLVELAAELVDLYAPAAEERGLELALHASGPVPLRVDPHLLRRAVANLLDNALHHARGGRRVEVRVARTSSGEALLEVADDGAGFSPELGEAVFQRTVRGPESPGFGLGLPLVRAAARAHGGDATAGRSDLGGASVTVRLPLGDRFLTESSSS